MEDGCWGLVPSSGGIRPVLDGKAWRASSEAAVGAAVSEGGENKKLQTQQLVFKHSLRYFFKRKTAAEFLLWQDPVNVEAHRGSSFVFKTWPYEQSSSPDLHDATVHELIS